MYILSMSQVKERFKQCLVTWSRVVERGTARASLNLDSGENLVLFLSRAISVKSSNHFWQVIIWSHYPLLFWQLDCSHGYLKRNVRLIFTVFQIFAHFSLFLKRFSNNSECGRLIEGQLNYTAVKTSDEIWKYNNCKDFFFSYWVDKLSCWMRSEAACLSEPAWGLQQLSLLSMSLLRMSIKGCNWIFLCRPGATGALLQYWPSTIILLCFAENLTLSRFFVFIIIQSKVNLSIYIFFLN